MKTMIIIYGPIWEFVPDVFLNLQSTCNLFINSSFEGCGLYITSYWDINCAFQILFLSTSVFQVSLDKVQESNVQNVKTRSCYSVKSRYENNSWGGGGHQ
jgi:hypothetical protein